MKFYDNVQYRDILREIRDHVWECYNESKNIPKCVSLTEQEWFMLPKSYHDKDEFTYFVENFTSSWEIVVFKEEEEEELEEDKCD